MLVVKTDGIQAVDGVLPVLVPVMKGTVVQSSEGINRLLEDRLAGSCTAAATAAENEGHCISAAALTKAFSRSKWAFPKFFLHTAKTVPKTVFVKNLEGKTRVCKVEEGMLV